MADDFGNIVSRRETVYVSQLSTAFGVSLGPLEKRVLAQIMLLKDATVRELFDSGTIERSSTTILTTLERLRSKGVLGRLAEQRTFRYVLTHSSEEVQRRVANEYIRLILTAENEGRNAFLSHLVEAAGEYDMKLLDVLENLIEQQRRGVKKTNSP